jgi:hypothetical protein
MKDADGSDRPDRRPSDKFDRIDRISAYSSASSRPLNRSRQHSDALRRHSAMNLIFSGRVTLRDQLYDYSGIWIRHKGRIDWKAIVRNADTVCRPRGTMDDELSDAEVLEVIRQLVIQSISDALESPRARIAEPRW